MHLSTSDGASQSKLTKDKPRLFRGGVFFFLATTYDASEIRVIPRRDKIAARSSSERPPQIP
jgi:hypothetical protein